MRDYSQRNNPTAAKGAVSFTDGVNGRALRSMAEHKVRRLPVIDGHQLVGIVAQADIARNVEEHQVGDLVESIST